MILCCGEALIDMLPETTTTGARAFVPVAGGAALNTSVALGRLGARVGLFSALSRDLFGAQLRNWLRASEVDTSYLIAKDAPLTLAFVDLREGEVRYAFYDENTAAQKLDISDLPALSPDITALVFGGISLVAAPTATTFEALFAREVGARLTMVDANIRPTVIGPRAKSYRLRLGRMLARTDIVKFSLEDLTWWDEALPAPGALAARARAFLGSQGPALAVLTQGEAGLLAVTATHTFEIPAPKVCVTDTVGAGDTFNAGLLFALERAGLLDKRALRDAPRPALEAALRFGVEIASLSVTRAGANPPWASELPLALRPSP